MAPDMYGWRLRVGSAEEEAEEVGENECSGDRDPEGTGAAGNEANAWERSLNAKDDVLPGLGHVPSGVLNQLHISLAIDQNQNRKRAAAAVTSLISSESGPRRFCVHRRSSALPLPTQRGNPGPAKDRAH